MCTRKPLRTLRLVLLTFALALGVGWLTIPTPAKPGDGTADDSGDTKKTIRKGWHSDRDSPPPIASDPTVKYDYPIVYGRVGRPYPKAYYGINHLNQAGLHQTNAPGAELRLLHPDGRDESLVAVEPQESITDPAVSFDGQWVYYAKFHHMTTGPTASMTNLQSRKGADIYKIHVPTRKVVQLTTQQRTPNTGAVPPGTESHPRGVHNLAPCPVAVDGVKAGENLATKFKALPEGRWELRLKEPIAALPKGRLTVSVRDRQGSVTQVERTLSVKP